MAETGVLKPEARVELLNGEVTDMSPIGERHGYAVRSLIEHFATLAKFAVIGVQDPIVLNEWSEPQPDFWLADRRIKRLGTHPTPADLLLVVEVADTTLQKDRRIKMPLYAAAGIREVWLVDILAQTMHIFRDPVANEYRDIRELKRGETIGPLAFPQHQLNFGDLFPQ